MIPWMMWVRPAWTRKAFSGWVKPKVRCFHTQKTAKMEQKAQNLKNLTIVSGWVT